MTPASHEIVNPIIDRVVCVKQQYFEKKLSQKKKEKETYSVRSLEKEFKYWVTPSIEQSFSF
jgi:hypothetical protein